MAKGSRVAYPHGHPKTIQVSTYDVSQALASRADGIGKKDDIGLLARNASRIYALCCRFGGKALPSA